MVSNFLYNHGAKYHRFRPILHSTEGGTYFMRLEFQTPHLDLSKQVLAQTFEEAVAKRYTIRLGS